MGVWKFICSKVKKWNHDAEMKELKRRVWGLMLLDSDKDEVKAVIEIIKEIFPGAKFEPSFKYSVRFPYPVYQDLGYFVLEFENIDVQPNATEKALKSYRQKVRDKLVSYYLFDREKERRGDISSVSKVIYLSRTERRLAIFLPFTAYGNRYLGNHFSEN